MISLGFGIFLHSSWESLGIGIKSCHEILVCEYIPICLPWRHFYTKILTVSMLCLLTGTMSSDLEFSTCGRSALTELWDFEWRLLILCQYVALYIPSPYWWAHILLWVYTLSRFYQNNQDLIFDLEMMHLLITKWLKKLRHNVNY